MSVETLELGLEAARLKAAELVATGLRTLEFYAAAFSSTPDSYGDIIDPHAFDEWLPGFYAKGQALPISFNHAAVVAGSDPTNVVGYAPADPEHVWVDSYGLRVKGFLDVVSEKGKAVEWQVEKKLLTGASLALVYEKGDRVKQGAHFLLKRITDVKEAGLVPSPANQDAVLLWMKSTGMLEAQTELPYMTVAEFRATFAETDEDLKHQSAGSGVQRAHDLLVSAGAKCAQAEAIEKSDDQPEPEEPKTTEREQIMGEQALARARRLRLLASSLP